MSTILTPDKVIVANQLTNDPDFQSPQWDRAAWPRRRARLAMLFLGKTRVQWQSKMEGSDICFGPVLRPSEAAQHPHNVARGIYLESGGVLQAAPAPRFGAAAYAPGAMAANGEHTQAVMDLLASGATKSVWSNGV